MSNNLKNILNYKSNKVESDKLKILEVLRLELLKFNFEEDYLNEGDLQLVNASALTFHSCVMENYTDTRTIDESFRPNFSNVPHGKKSISEFNVWDYELTYGKEFENFSDEHEILKSHHAIACNTCKQQGKIRCSSCSGAGNITCSSCGGRGENQCSNCNGQVDIKCWSCSGKGTKETGYGENKRTERCTSCSGRGSNKCSSCKNGWINCSSCNSSGKVTCYDCQGSGEIICYECDGHRTMDHFFIVTSNFINVSQTLYLTNPYPGFDQNKVKTNNFIINEKLFELKEKKFEESHFQEIKSSPFYKQITSFLDFSNSNETKLITSRITFFENFYFEVMFSFYGEKYTVFLDKNLENSYYNENKPSDQYELDLLKKSIDCVIKNELGLAKKTVQKLANYNFIKISENEIIRAIEDTEYIYTAKDEINNRSYNHAESTLRLVSNEKKNEADYGRLIKKLNLIYFANTSFFGLVGFLAIAFMLINKDNQFVLWNIIIAISIICSCWLLNKFTRNINWSRWLVLILLSIQFFTVLYIEDKKGSELKSAKLKTNDFEEFKSKKKKINVIYHDRDKYLMFEFANGTYLGDVILIENTEVYDKLFVMKKGANQKWYDYEVSSNIPNKISKYQNYVQGTDFILEALQGSFDLGKEVIVRDWEKGWRFSLKLKDVGVIDRIGVICMFDNQEDYENKKIDTVFIPTYIYALINKNQPINNLSIKNIPTRNLNANDFKNTLTIEKGSKDYVDNSKTLNTNNNNSSTNNNNSNTDSSKKSYFDGEYKFQTTFDNPVMEVPLREQPDVSSREVYKCPKNATVYVIDNSGGTFFKVHVNGYTGYLSKGWLLRQE
jgi:hypothetical protein